jgi:hypothetical protein
MASCSGSTPTSATTTATTTTAATPADPAFNEQFTGTLPVDGASFYSFTVTQYGTVNITLASIGGTYVPSTVTMALGLGQPSGEDCAVSTSLSTRSGPTPQITGAYSPGVYCARISDVGNLYAPARFSIDIAYP